MRVAKFLSRPERLLRKACAAPLGNNFSSIAENAPRIWASSDRVDLALDLSVVRVPCSVVHIFAVTRELTMADEIFYLILQGEACRGRVTVSVVEQAKLVLMLLQDLPL